MLNSKSIYDATSEFNDSLGIQKDLMKFREDSLMQKFIQYVDNWIFYNEFFLDEKNNSLFDWLLENSEPVNVL